MAPLVVSSFAEKWLLRQAFVIARGAKTEAHVVCVSVSDGRLTGRGECVPYARYGETVAGVLADIEQAVGVMGSDVSRAGLQDALKPGAARNALDCALWDWEAKSTGIAVHNRLGIGQLAPVKTCYTLSLGAPDEMANAARSVPQLSLLKLKLGGAGDRERMLAVRAARPDARLVADANEAWTAHLLPMLMAAAHEAGMETIEQPLPANADEILRSIPHVVPICADESAHTADDVAGLVGRYDAVNIKLDKAGGLTGALDMMRAARSAGLKVMVGSMVATSLAAAPAFLLAQQADWVDLDGPLLLAQDRDDGFVIEAGVMAPPSAGLWG